MGMKSRGGPWSVGRDGGCELGAGVEWMLTMSVGMSRAGGGTSGRMAGGQCSHGKDAPVTLLVTRKVPRVWCCKNVRSGNSGVVRE